MTVQQPLDYTVIVGNVTLVDIQLTKERARQLRLKGFTVKRQK